MSENKANIGPKIILEGEAAYKKSLSDVGSSMKVLKSELKAVTAEFDGNANSVEALKAKNEVLLKQQTDQEKKLALLRGALEDANKLYGAESVQVQNWQTKLNNAYADLSKLNKEIDSNEKYLKEAEASTDKTAKSIDEFGKEIKNTKQEALTFGDVLKANLSSQAIISGVKALGNALKDVVGATVNVVKESAAYADNILTMSAQTGIATDKLQELNYMSELTDTSIETITSSMARNIRSMNSASNGTKLYTDAYRQLGIQITDANGQLKDSGEVFWQSIDALGKMANETERDAIAMQLFGRSAQDLNPLIKIGSDQVAQFAQEARDMGAVLSNETLSKLGETDDALQRLYQQIDISKRTIGADIAPAVTQGIGTITEKIDEADDKFASFAEGAITDVTNAFLWMIDNADLIAAGLKGIGAALITKKAADGINAAVVAYKALTMATETATGATVALNTATKASVIGAIASVVIGASAAIYSYAKSAADAAEETRKLNDTTQILIDKSKEAREAVQGNTQDRQKELDNIKAEASAAKTLVDSLYDLSDGEDKSNATKEQMLSLVEQINKAMPDLNLTIDEQTGLINKQRGEVEKLIQSRIELSTAEALQGQLTSIALDKYNQEQKLNGLLEEEKSKREELAALQEELDKHSDYNAWTTDEGNVRWAVDAEKDIKRVNKELENNATEVENVRNVITGLEEAYKSALDYIGDHTAIDRANTALGEFLEKYKTSLDEQNEAYENGLDDRINAIEDYFDTSEKALEKNQKAERKALEKAHDEQIKMVEDAADEELKILEKAHKEKLDLIDEEYLEKMKLVDEERYEKLKAVQDQIDSIDVQNEAEDRARALKEEAEKRAELTAQVAAATTAEDKLAAQQELADFEEEIARERLETERELQKEILENQKDTINEEYDAKIKSLEEEQKKKEETAKNDYENEKQAIADRLETKKQEISDIQEIEATALEDKQTAEQEAVDKQKAYAVQSAKDTYEEDLKEFKLNNALKYDEAVSNQDAINKYVLEHQESYSNPLSIFNPPSAYDSSYLFKNQYGQPSAAYYPAINYDDFETAVSNALKNMNLVVVLDGKKIGKVVENRVNEMLQ